MLFKSTTLVLATLTSALAAPALNQLVIGSKPAQAALSWGAQTISQVGVDGGDVHAMTQWGYYDCGEPTDAIQLKSIKVSPDPPAPGKNLTIYATGTVKDLVTEGAYADVTVKLGLIKLLTKRFDVCEELDNAKSTLQCPIKPDEYEVVQTVELPAEIPRAKFLVQARVFTQDDAPAACLDLWINFLVPDKVQ